MAPEQATGGPIDARADVHALAAVAYQMLTGRLAREGSIAELAHAALPVAPSRLDPALPSEVDEVLLRSLDPSPEARYPSMDSFVAAFRSALPLTSPARPGSATTRYQTPDTHYAPLPETGPPARRKAPVLLTLVTLLVFAATFAAAYAVTTLVS
jgi:serine/threonine protein kinase